ncbi:tRNA(Glu)-specific nuclease WapA precursor [Streptomyces turgidiscabies]|nr:tRNA(Glu)-specific nuclease WapA precursor [Streptomyces turgidiscabies]
MTLGEGDEQIVLQWKGGLPKPKLDGTRAEYVNAVPGADVVVEATRTGFEQYVEIKERPGSGGYSYTLPLKAKGLKAKQLSDGSILFTDKKNNKRAVMPAPVMWDATVDKRSGEHTNRAKVGLKVLQKGSSVDLVITPDAEFLTDPGTQYPVTVDPSTSSLSNVFDTYVQQGETVDWSTDTELDLGNPGTTNSDGTPRTARSFISWNTTPIQDALVLDAKLSLWNFHSGNNTDCALYPWEVWSTGAASRSSRWTAQPSWTAKKATSTETRGNTSCTAQPDGWINADATTLVQEWASAKATRGHMGLRATSETALGQWKRINSANAASNPPKLVVNYNYRPRTGTKQEAGPPYFSYSGAYTVNTTTPTLRDTFVDPNGDKVDGTFQIYDSATDTQVGDVLVSPFVPSGQVTSVNVPSGLLANGKTYKFRTSPYDGTHYNTGWSAWKTFTVDTSAPSAPTQITSTDYPTSSWVKGAGQAGTFTVTPPATDHNWLEWSLDDVTWTKVSTSGSASAKNISVTPPNDGTHLLQVRSVDKADNKSEPVEYTFHAGPGGFVQPAEGERTARRLPLAAEADAAKYNAVKFSWRRSKADVWTEIPPTDVTAGGTALTAWPVALTNGKSTSLVWNATTTVDPDGTVEIKADFTGPNGASGSSNPRTIVVDRNADGAAVQLVGPGSLNLLTGNYTLSENDTSYYDMTVSRTFSSRSTDAAAEEDGQVPIFGPEWVSGTVAETNGSAYAYVRRTSDTALDVVTTDGDAVHFAANAGRTGWIPEPGAEGLVLTGSVSGAFTLTDAEGAVTTFAKLDSSSTTWQVSSTELDGRDDSTTTIMSETVTVDGKQLARPKRIIAPTSAISAATCSSTPTTKGCRVLEFVYATSTTATAAAFGDYTGRVKEVLLYGTGKSATSSTARAVATYRYDANGSLRQQWNPRLAQSTQKQYAYDSAGRVTTYQPATDQPWTFTYGNAGSADTAGDGMLLSVSRPTLQQGTSTTVDGNAVTSIVYDVPLTGTNAPHAMGAADVRAWGQADVPTDATALFPPDSVPSSHAGSSLASGNYARAAITYLGASGRQVDTAVPGGHISMTEYDHFGNVVRELTAANRALALGTTGSDKAAQAELGIGALTTAERALLLSTTSVYSDGGGRKMEEFGPLNRTDLTKDLTSGTTTLVSAGASVAARAWSVNEYDAGRPTDGSATVKDQLTKTTVGVQVREHPTIHGETRVDQTVYDWAKGLPTKTIQDPGDLAVTNTTEYDTQGRVVKQLDPGATGSDAATHVTTYWAASGTGTCQGRPEWADLICSVGPAGAITGGGSNPTQLPITTYEYDSWGNTTTTVDSANSITRTATATYDAAGRPTTVAVTGGTGQTLPTATVGYDSATGRAVTRTSPTAGTITKVYDTLGREISYTDADAATTTTEYDKLDRPSTITDSVPSTVTFTYNHSLEPRGMATSATDSIAGTFHTTYNANATVSGEKLPGGYTLTQKEDTTGSAVSRTYTRDSDGTLILSDAVTESGHGQVTTHSGWSDQTYRHDAIGRLTTVEDTTDTVCTRRSYTFGARSTRTGLTTSSAAPGTDCPTSGGTTTTHTYDSADRLVDSGYVYDAFGRTTTSPDHGTISYYTNDLVYQQTTSAQRQTWQLDAGQRFRSWTVESNSSGSWAQTASRLNHYDSDADSPRWTVEDTSTGALTRYINAATGDLTATTSKTGDVVLQMTNLHGDVALQLPLDAGKAPIALDSDEYGNPRTGQATTRYGWLGGKQRPADTPTGLVLMGVRLYDPRLGRFLQTDPVAGGSANAYDYSNQDPCNSSDTTGAAPNCGSRKTRYGYGMRIVVSRRGGGIAKNGFRYIGYYINIQVMGGMNRYLSKNYTWGETYGVRPGKRGKLVKLQSKGSWMNPGKLSWAVHYNVQVKPGSIVWTHGGVVVFGFRGFIADMVSSCRAR